MLTLRFAPPSHSHQRAFFAGCGATQRGVWLTYRSRPFTWAAVEYARPKAGPGKRKRLAASGRAALICLPGKSSLALPGQSSLSRFQLVLASFELRVGGRPLLFGRSVGFETRLTMANHHPS